MEKPAFYKKLTTWGKKHYDVQEARKPHTERFIKLMIESFLKDSSHEPLR